MPLDFTGNDPNKFQDVQQYAPGDVRGVLAQLQSAENTAQASASQPIPEAPVRPDGGFTNREDAMAFRSAMRAHNEALRDASAYAQHAKYLHDTLHAANVQADAGDFHKEFAHVAMDDPDLQDKAAALLAKYPGSASDEGVQHSLSMKLNANAKHLAINEANQKQEEAYQEKASKVIAAGVADGSLTQDDFPVWDGKSAMPKYLQRNPRTGNITYNLDYVTQLSAAKKAAGYGNKSESAAFTSAKNLAAAMKSALADPDLDPASPQAQALKQAHDLATQRMAQEYIAGGKQTTTGNVPGAQATAPKPASSWVVSLKPKTP